MWKRFIALVLVFFVFGCAYPVYVYRDGPVPQQPQVVRQQPRVVYVEPNYGYYYSPGDVVAGSILGGLFLGGLLFGGHGHHR